MGPDGFSGRRAERADSAPKIAKAYAVEYDLPLQSIIVQHVTVVGTDKQHRAQRLKDSLSVGLVSGAGAFRVVRFVELDGVPRVRRDDHRSAAELPQAMIAPTDAVAEIFWEFGSATPAVTSYVVSGERRMVFDTLASMPVLPDFAAMFLTLG